MGCQASRSGVGALALVATVLFSFSPATFSPASAETYPSRPITMIEPFPPGGANSQP